MTWIDELSTKVARMSDSPWSEPNEYGFVCDAHGEEVADILGNIEDIEGVIAIRNNAERLIAVARAAGKALNAWDAGNEEAEMDALRAALEWK